SERAHGGYFDDLDADGMRAIMPSLFTTLDAVRETSLEGTSGFGVWNATGHARHDSWRAALLSVNADHPRLPGWRERLAGDPVRERVFREAYERLAHLAEGVPEVRHLVYSDLLNYNVLVEGDRITSVLDWGASLYGDFVYDVAWLAYFASWYPAWAGIDFAEEAARHYASIGLAVPAYEARLRCAELHIGLDSMGYAAFTGRWHHFDWNVERIHALVYGA